MNSNPIKIFLHLTSKKLFFVSLLILIGQPVFAGEISQINSYETWNANPKIIPSTDPAGISWNSANWHLYITDSEINEENSWNDENIFETDMTGSQLFYSYETRPGYTGTSREPTGICYYPGDDHYYIVNDSRKELFQYDINAGSIELLQVWKLNENGLPFIADDPEGITVNPANGHFYIADGADGLIQIIALQVSGSSLVYLPSESFSLAAKQNDAEGVAYRPSSGTLFVVSALDGGGTIFEWNIQTGAWLDSYSLALFDPAPISPQGLTFGPRSSNPAYESLYIADGGLDNNDVGWPACNDGMIYEAKIGLEDVSLPVQLTSFTADCRQNEVLLRWRTESELENLGFDIRRADEENGDFTTISSYRENTLLTGQGNSSSRHEYTYTDKTVRAGKTYWYTLADWDIRGQETTHGPVSVSVRPESAFPDNPNLYSNYPNPFNPSTYIRFDIPSTASGSVDTRLIIYNTLGQTVKTLLSKELPAGSYKLQWDGTTDRSSQVPSGIYYARLIAGPFSKSIKMSLIR